MERLEGAGSRIKSRALLLGDLEQAVVPDGPPSELAVIGFPGLKAFLEASRLEMATAWEATSLLQRLGARFTRVVPPEARLYASRRGEFCALAPAEPKVNWMRVSTALDDELLMTPVRSALVVVALPGEATTAAGALRLGDQRLRAQSGPLRPGRESGAL
jgi:hypothetical protein